MLLAGGGAISQAAEAARAFGLAQQLAGVALARLCILVEELVANLYDHGGVGEDDEVGLAMARDSAGIRISITDPGLPFDPWSAALPAESDERGGGAGLSLIQAWAQQISYRSSGETNHLELLLPVDWED